MKTIKVKFLEDVIELEKEGQYLKSYNGSLVKATKEEYVLQCAIRYITNKFDYPITRVDDRVPVIMGSDTKEADAVIYSDDKHKKAFIVIETKSPDKDNGLRQGISYANALGARYVFWSNGIDKATYDVEKEEEVSNIPVAYKIKKLIYGNGVGLEQQPLRSINDARQKFKKCHDILRDVEKKSTFFAFQIFSRLLYKILDPFCGSGGFLVYSLYHVKNKLEAKFSRSLVQRHKFEFAHYN